MTSFHLPNKVTWLVDLTKDESARFPSTVLHRLVSEGYSEHVRIETLSSDMITTLFVPLYERLMMGRPDFRLDVDETHANFTRMSHDPTYNLLWFTEIGSGAVLGGIVIHWLDDQAREAYRCFDREQARVFHFTQLDYYAAVQLQRLARDRQYSQLFLGNDHHPVTQLGLSLFKLRIGARPVVSTSAKEVLIEEEGLRALAMEHGVAGYYGDPAQTAYTRFYLYGTESHILSDFLTVAQEAGIEVVRK